jgi:putative hemolysin
MAIEQILQIILITALLSFSASFSAVETALFSLSKTDLDEMRRTGSLIGKNILTVLSNPRDLLTTILFGNEFVNVGIAILAGSLGYTLMEGYDWKIVYLVSVGVSTLVILIFGEIFPKTLALRNAVSVSYLFIGLLRLFAWLTKPLRWILTLLIDQTLILIGGDPHKTRRMLMEEEFMNLVDIGRQSGIIDEMEHTIIENIFDFDDQTVEEIMVPKEKIMGIEKDAPVSYAFQFLDANRFSRLPIYRENLNQIEGVLFAKDLIIYKLGGEQSGQLHHLIRPAHFISPKMPLNEALQKFRKERIHLAIVKDNGNVVGLVTMDDLLKELST